MRQRISILFILLYSVLLIKPIVPIINYHIQLQAYKTRCINLQKPLLECNGTCQLQSELKTDSSELPPTLPLTKSGPDDTPVFLVTDSTPDFKNTNSSQNDFTSLAFRVCGGFNGAIFHPPAPVCFS